LATHYVALDLETTGLDRDSDAIIEIGAVRFDGSGAVVETFETLVNPHVPLPPQVQDLTGISDAELAEAPPIYLVASQFQAFIGDDPLVGHNIINFDVPFLSRAGIVTSARVRHAGHPRRCCGAGPSGVQSCRSRRALRD
jgi:DNA polymerase III epsilon subunit family exonuclease